MKIENEEYWTERYLRHQTGWDIGYVSTPIKEYIDQLEDKNFKILIPGCGNGYEVEYLWEKGFRNTFVVDISPVPLGNLKKRIPEFPESHLIHGDFFALTNTYDLILEQTFFSVFPPSERQLYVDKVFELLKPGAKLVGVLFNIDLNVDRPPYGGSINDYRPLFSQFETRMMVPCYNSIPERAGNEIFISVQKANKKE